MTKRRVWLATIIGCCSIAAGTEFDAASIRPWKPNPASGGSRSGGALPAPDGGHLLFAPGRVTTPWTGVTARRIILESYSVGNYRVGGGPDWIDSDMYRLEAKSTDSSASENQLRSMLQTLLANRFHLVLHHVRREMPVYALSVRKGGPKVREWTAGDDSDAARAALQDAFAHGAGDASITTMARYVERMNNDRMNLLHGMPGIDRPVVDKTGLTGC